LSFNRNEPIAPCAKDFDTLLTQVDRQHSDVAYLHDKLEFVRAACSSEVPFEIDLSVHDSDVLRAAQWVGATASAEVMQHRERVIARIEAAAAEHRASGHCQKWFGNADRGVMRVAEGFNGPIAEELAAECMYSDAACINIFREGGDVVGDLVDSGCGKPAEFRAACSVEALKAECGVNNRKLLASLKQDEFACELMDEMYAEAAIGRVTYPVPIKHVDLECSVIARRFAIPKASGEDGEVTVRCVDDETACGTNPCVKPAEKLKCDGIDSLVALLVILKKFGCGELSLWKADIKAAYRRIPVKPEQRWLLWVALIYEGEIVAARHNAMPFGCTGMLIVRCHGSACTFSHVLCSGSVHAWNRIGHMLRTFAVKFLFIPVCRWHMCRVKFGGVCTFRCAVFLS
jgi:hypothetical protein